MNKLFMKFPATPHLFAIDHNISRADKLVDYQIKQLFYQLPVSIEEKVDGANIGFSLTAAGDILVQNRGNYITADSHPQYRLLSEWITRHQESLFELLLPGRILFGEWCYAKHSVYYDKLFDWFLAFDIYDIEAERFLSCEKRHELLRQTQIKEVPKVGRFEKISDAFLLELIKQPSRLRLDDKNVEGLYLRIDCSGYLLHRAKIVRGEFTQQIEEHWKKKKLQANELASRQKANANVE
jgi:ATP-dependent RNA circularization protein (DNA/RNA ligase family)